MDGAYAMKSLSEAVSLAKRLMKEVTWSHDCVLYV